MPDWNAAPAIPSRDFPQRLHIGDYAVLLGQSKATGGYSGGQGLVQITGVEPFHLLDQHGALLVWIDTTSPATPNAGYGTLDTNGVTAHIPASGSIQTTGGLQKLQFLHKQLAQLRFRLKWITTPTGAVQDYDVQILNPVNTQRGAFAHVNAVLNAFLQPHDANDIVVLPAQGSNEAAPAANNYDAFAWWEAAARTEQWLLEDNSMGVKVTNNGSVITAAGSLALQVSGYVYNFANIEAAAGFKPVNYLPTVPLMIPPDVDRREIVPIQIGARNPW